MRTERSAAVSYTHLDVYKRQLLVGVNSDPIRMEPYIPAFFETRSVKAIDLGIEISSDAKVILAPNVGSYVGGDITAGTLASGIWNRPEFSLFIDLGTNGELVFGNEDFLMTCACSAGPAFEGGDISCGMRCLLYTSRRQEHRPYLWLPGDRKRRCSGSRR